MINLDEYCILFGILNPNEGSVIEVMHMCILRPSHTGGKTGCKPAMTKKGADHQRPSATIGQKKM